MVRTARDEMSSMWAGIAFNLKGGIKREYVANFCIMYVNMQINAYVHVQYSLHVLNGLKLYIQMCQDLTSTVKIPQNYIGT